MRAMTYRGPDRVRVEGKPTPRTESPTDAMRGGGRVDAGRSWMDPLVPAGPAPVAVGALGLAARALLRRR